MAKSSQSVGFDDQVRFDLVRARGDRRARCGRPPRFVIERKLHPARPPGVVGGRRVDVLAEVLIEHDRLRSQAVEIRRFDPVVAVAADVTQVPMVEADDDGLRPAQTQSSRCESQSPS